MHSVNLVVFQSDPQITKSLVANLGSQFHCVYVARPHEDLRAAIARHRPKVVILDVELSSLADVNTLHKEFPGVAIVCTHRLADEEMWTAALAAGAEDICPSSDTTAILRSAMRNAALARSAAA
jgi:DNA-binding NarL/FixJ family response regulator